MSVELSQRIFNSRQALQTFLRDNRISNDFSKLPAFVSLDSDDPNSIVLTTLEDVVFGTDRQAFARRGLYGVQVAATHTADDVVSNVAEKIYALGETAPIAVVGEILVAADGLADTFSGTLDRRPVVPGTVTIQAPTQNDVVEPTVPNGNLEGAGDTGTIDYLSGDVTLDYNAPPAAGDITADYSWDPASAAIDIPPGAHLSRLEILHIAGTGNPTFDWTLYEDENGNTPIATGTTAAMGVGTREQIALDLDSVIQDPRIGQQGRRWLGLQASANADHVVVAKLLFRAAL